MNIFKRWIGVRMGEFVVTQPGQTVINLPFTPKEVYIDWDLTGIGCVDSGCKVQVEKKYNGFVVDVEYIGERIKFSWLATKF